MAFKNSCPTLAKVADNEPIFVLRAQDRSAPLAILYWMHLNPDLPQEKRREAFQCAEQMFNWPKRKSPD